MSILQHVSSECNRGEILKDTSKSGKNRPWRKHKYLSSVIAASYRRLAVRSHFDTARYVPLYDDTGQMIDVIRLRTSYDTKAEAMESCSSVLRFGSCPHGHERKLTWASFCRVRLCPMCAWRRSLLIAHQIRRVGHEVAKMQKVRWLFLTLTVRNVPFEELQQSISHLMQSFRRLSMYKRFKGSVLGWYRSLEVTRNLDKHSESYGTFHPHLHVLLCVEPSYFTRSYISHGEWTEMWRKALKVKYTPIVHVQTVKPKRNRQREMDLLLEHGIDVEELGVAEELTGAAIAETAKYSVKPSDLVVFSDACYCSGKCTCEKPQKDLMDYRVDEEETDFSVFAFDSALSGRRLKAYGGLLKEVWNRLREEEQLQDVEDDDVDLVHVTEDTRCTCSVCQSALLETLYRWMPGANQYISWE